MIVPAEIIETPQSEELPLRSTAQDVERCDCSIGVVFRFERLFDGEVFLVESLFFFTGCVEEDLFDEAIKPERTEKVVHLLERRIGEAIAVSLMERIKQLLCFAKRAGMVVLIPAVELQFKNELQ